MGVTLMLVANIKTTEEKTFKRQRRLGLMKNKLHVYVLAISGTFGCSI